MKKTLFFDIEGGESFFVANILDKFYNEALNEANTYKDSNDEDAKEIYEDWINRANKYKKMLDELEKYIEIEDNTVWRFIKGGWIGTSPSTERFPKKHRKVLDYIPLPCTNCGSVNTIGNGYRKNSNHSVPKRKCRNCGRKYTNKEDSFFKMKFQKEIIEYAIKLLNNGLSTKAVAESILQRYHVKVSHVSVSNWSKSDKISKVFQQIPEKIIDKPIEHTANNKREAKQGAFINYVKTQTPEIEMFRENEGFDYRAKSPKIIGQSEVYESGTGKIVIRYHGKGCMGEIILTSKEDIDRLLNYSESDANWCIKNLSKEKQNILHGYLRDVKKLSINKST